VTFASRFCAQYKFEGQLRDKDKKKNILFKNDLLWFGEKFDLEIICKIMCSRLKNNFRTLGAHLKEYSVQPDNKMKKTLFLLIYLATFFLM